MQSTGNIIENGNGVTLKQIEDKALSGDPDAMFDLACIYHSGNIKGVGLDYHKAYHWCRKAVELGHANAVFHMGLLHENGEGVEKKDLRMACECYHNAAKSGHVGAMFHLAKCYENGCGTYLDGHEAKRWGKKAEALGYVDDSRVTWKPSCVIATPSRSSERGFARLVLWVIGLKNVLLLLLLSALVLALGFVVAGKMKSHSGEPLSESDSAPCDLPSSHSSDSDAADPNSYEKLGEAYYYGEGVDRDYAKAFQLFEKAAAANDSMAMFYLGRIYDEGRGVSQDYGKSYYWYVRAAKAGNGAAMKSLGDMYYNGRGVEKDLEKASAWYESAKGAGIRL